MEFRLVRGCLWDTRQALTCCLSQADQIYDFFFLRHLSLVLSSLRCHDIPSVRLGSASFTEVDLEYAAAGPISPGAQLFALARTLYALETHTVHGSPDAGNAAAWQSSVAI